MSEKLRTDFTKAERDAIIWSLRDEYGDREFSEELILLECQDLWRKGCHNIENGTECHGCGPNGECGLDGWEKRHPEYKDDALAARLKELRDEVAEIQRAEITKRLLEKGYVKVQWKRFYNDGKIPSFKSNVLLYFSGSNELKAAIADAIETWKKMFGAQNLKLDVIDLYAKSGTILKLSVRDGNAYEIWEII